jgi:hypothetical protein
MRAVELRCGVTRRVLPISVKANLRAANVMPELKQPTAFVKQKLCRRQNRQLTTGLAV